MSSFPADLLVHSNDTEDAVLYSVFEDNNLLKDIYSHILQPHDFYTRKNQVIYSAMLDLLAEEKPILMDLVYFKICSKNEQGYVGRGHAILDLDRDENFSATAAPEKYAEIIFKYSAQRQISRLGQKISDAGYDKKLSIEQLRDSISDQLEIVDNFMSQDAQDIISPADIVLDIIDKIDSDEDLSGLKTQFKDLDEMIQGLRGSDLIVLAGRPAMGKTALAVNIMSNIAMTNEDKKILFFSLEMSTEQIVERLISMEARVDSMTLKDKEKLTYSDWERINRAGDVIKSTKNSMLINDTASMTINSIRSIIDKQVTSSVKPDLVIIDYLQLISSNQQFERNDLKIAHITRNLKIIAKTYDIPVIILSQLNRKCEERTNKRPILSDLRDSGAIEQDADIVFFVYRDEVYNKDTEDRGFAEVIVSKNRHGSVGTAKLGFIKIYTRFVNKENFTNHMKDF